MRQDLVVRFVVRYYSSARRHSVNGPVGADAVPSSTKKGYHTMNTVDLNRAICAIARSHVVAERFPGVHITPTEDGMFDITAPDQRYNRSNIGLEQLTAEVGSVVFELQGKYGEHGEGLGDLVLDIRINEKPTGK